jgi:hypothetical protein
LVLAILPLYLPTIAAGGQERFNDFTGSPSFPWRGNEKVEGKERTRDRSILSSKMDSQRRQVLKWASDLRIKGLTKAEIDLKMSVLSVDFLISFVTYKRIYYFL